MKRVLAALGLAIIVAGCGLLPTQSASGENKPFMEIDVPLGKGVALTTFGEDSTTAWGPNDCAERVHQLTTPTGNYLVILIKPGCTGSPTAGNGFHGYYAEPPGGFKSAETPVGPAKVFSNSYYECTNHCTYGTDEVALVDVDGRIIQVTAVTRPSSGETTRSRLDLLELLKGLHRT